MTEKTMDDIGKNLSQVRERMERAATKVGRDPAEIRLIAVTKTVPIERVKEAIRAGATIIGENYVQEARNKSEEIGQTGIEWHFIGHLQSNKAKYAVRLFDLIHSVDSIKVAQALDTRAAVEGKVMDCLIEVNISQEESKFGITSEHTLTLAQEMTKLKNISLKGLMTMPPYFDDPESSRPYFIALRQLKEAMEEENIPLSELSMGMTTDFEVAIEEGATMVRVGRAIFGERSE